MNPGTDLELQLLNRAYCYLRLSGVTAAVALEGLQSSLEVLTDEDEVWSRLQSLRSSGEPAPSAPPLLRGLMHYPPR